MKNYNKIATYVLPTVLLGMAIILWPQSSLSQETTTPDSNTVQEAPAPVVTERETAEQNTWAQYQIILQCNIFSRQRGPIRQRSAERPRPVITRNLESYLVLKGIVQEGGTFIAFIENTQNSTVLRLREGENVARGTVKNFSLDSIEYQLGDSTINVTIGHDLEGGQGTLPMSRLLQMSATTPTASDPNAPATQPAPSGDEADILKRLMEQRKQQLGQ
jgi:hypothetical protein